jgi:hypothetical protein
VTYDAGNRKDVRRAEKAARLKQRARFDYTRRIMSEAQGREWMYDLLFRCHIGVTPFVAGRPDLSDFYAGEQNIGLQLWTDAMNSSPTEYVLMMQEASHKELSNDRHDSNERPAGGELNGSSDGGRNAEGPEPGDYDPLHDAGEEG